jgi:SAM-dependent methyltransferase
VKWLLDRLRDPSVNDIDVDGDGRLTAHSKMLARKRMLREVFTEFHHSFHRLDQQYFSASGLQVELGAGIAPMRDSFPYVLATDIVHGPHLDRALDAEAMDMADGSVRSLFGQNCFHHFPHPQRFFAEAERVLAPGGGIVLIEPYYGPLATFLYKRLFRTEGFDKAYPSWETPATGPMNGANQALSYIVFIRDKNQFDQRFPGLELVHQELAGNYLKYLLSGGLNFRQLCPDGMSPLVDFMQWCLRPFNRWLALHHTIVVRKRPS